MAQQIKLGFALKKLDLLWKENLVRSNFMKRIIYDGSPICCRLTVVSRPRDRIKRTKSKHKML